MQLVLFSFVSEVEMGYALIIRRYIFIPPVDAAFHIARGRGNEWLLEIA